MSEGTMIRIDKKVKKQLKILAVRDDISMSKAIEKLLELAEKQK